jgi:signal transduction histidine kinase
VHITGSGSGVYRLTPAVARGTLDVLRACLENALRHSGTDVAEVDLAYTDTELTMTITDQGVGFDPAAIDDDRLGVRFSIIERAERAGGSAKIWSSPGSGTSVIVRMPVEEKLTGHEESRHAAG